MNGKKRKNKKPVLDSDNVTHYLRSDFGIKSFYYEQIFFKILIFIISHFCIKKLKRNESQIEDSFQI